MFFVVCYTTIGLNEHHNDIFSASKERFNENFPRILGATWLLASMLIAQAFAGQGRANLIVQTPTLRFDYLEDVTSRPKLKIYYTKNTPIEAELKVILDSAHFISKFASVKNKYVY